MQYGRIREEPRNYGREEVYSTEEPGEIDRTMVGKPYIVHKNERKVQKLR